MASAAGDCRLGSVASAWLRRPGIAGLIWLTALGVLGCTHEDATRTITLWHQMRPEDRAILDKRIAEFQRTHPGVRVRPLYKETEELRSGLVSAVLAQRGPEVIYGPSDLLGVYHAMGALQDMSPWVSEEETKDFDPRAVIRLPASDQPERNELIFLGDRFGNHLALVYNKRWISKPPQTTDELVQLARANTVDEDGDGQPERYGIVWNYTEPFFFVPFLTGFGAWVFEDAPTGDRVTPTLDTAQARDAFNFVASLRNKYRVLPRSADYETARALFLAGKAAMIIDGDWSWQNYLSDPSLDASIAVLPTVSQTGLPMSPMVAPKGYSLSALAKGESAQLAMELIRFLTSEATQRQFLVEQRILPSRMKLRTDRLVTGDPIMATSVAQLERGRAMPTELEIRAVWDAMRPPYQLLMAGQIEAGEATKRMQRDALSRIEAMTERTSSDSYMPYVYLAVTVAVGILAATQLQHAWPLIKDLRRNPLAYALVLPAMALILLTVLYPLAYNIGLSFSNMSLTNLRDWEIVGLKNYTSLATGRESAAFWSVFAKTIFWTAVNVFFHVTLGVLLAVILDGPVRGKSVYRILLVIPWAVPAYITALTWRGMFDEQFGAVNHLIRALAWVNQYLPHALQLKPLNWLGEAGPAFAACIIANVWLGFPFMMVIALGGLQGIPAELYEAARIDRASRWKQFRHITLPMLMPVLIPAVTLGAVWTFNNLNIVWLVSNTGEPGDKTHILVSYVYKAVFNNYQYGYGAALSMVLFLMLLAFALVFLRGTRATERVA